MLKRMLLINSANFQLADVDLSKEIFFVGDNVSGKTTTTRALHFLYNGNGEQLGIPRTKSSFSKHYFPHDDSYIIYVFESFFIFTYKKNDTIKRWFSKQEFNLNEVIKDGILLDFKTIIDYVKQAPLKVKPESIQSYTDILYGKDKAFLDFSIAKIENYKIFLDVYNMIFNVDKSIVTAVDIKKAIQKSLDRRDEVLSIDYDDFMRKLNEFSRAYNFFKVFDNNRENLSNAIASKNSLILLEHRMDSVEKAIHYKSKVEINEFNELATKKSVLRTKSDQFKVKAKRFDKFHSNYEKRIKAKINSLNVEIIQLEVLKGKFDLIELEANIEMASKHDRIKSELDSKKIDLSKLKDELSSTQKIIENQIKQVEYKISTTIPNEMSEKLFALSEVEKNKFEEEKLLIENECNELENSLNKEIEQLEQKIQNFKSDITKNDEVMLDEIRNLRKNTSEHIQVLKTDLAQNNSRIEQHEKELRGLRTQKDLKDTEFRKHDSKYLELRKSNCKSLLNTRSFQNQVIANAKAILHPIKNSFQEFLSREIDDWEKEIYPIIDKDLLGKSCDELNPIKLDLDAPIVFKINTENLSILPTKDEAIEIIRKARYEKFHALKNSKLVYKEEIAALDEIKNKIISEIESIEAQSNTAIEVISRLISENKRLESKIAEQESTLEKDILAVSHKYNLSRGILESEKKSIQVQRDQKKNKELSDLRKAKLQKIVKLTNDRESNINILKGQIEKEKRRQIEQEKETITALKEKIVTTKKDELISSLSIQVDELQKAYNKSYDAKKYLEEYDLQKDKILELPLKERNKKTLELMLNSREELLININSLIEQNLDQIQKEMEKLSTKIDKYEKGIKKYKQLQFDTINVGDEIITEEFLIDLITQFEDIDREYKNERSKFRTLIDKLKKLEKHSIIEINLNNEFFDEAQSIMELTSIIESLEELANFEKNKYDSEKKRRHNNFDTFLKNTIPSKLQSFDDLEMDFEKAKNSINKSLANADFGVIKNIRLDTGNSEKRADNIASLMKQLSLKTNDTINLYSKNSLFYYDVPKSVDNIKDIESILEEIKLKGSNGMLYLFDTIDLTISYTENGKSIDNKHNIKDDSSSGGNILLKVAIAMSLLTRFAKKNSHDTPFFLIIDEISKLQNANQNLLKDYINNNGFKTLFITPDPAYPDPEKAIYYTFKNIQEDGDTLEIRQMNII